WSAFSPALSLKLRFDISIPNEALLHATPELAGEIGTITFKTSSGSPLGEQFNIWTGAETGQAGCLVGSDRRPLYFLPHRTCSPLVASPDCMLRLILPLFYMDNRIRWFQVVFEFIVWDLVL